MRECSQMTGCPSRPFGKQVDIMELRQLKYFLEVARTRNFTRAADNLCVAQPSVTKAIQNLEGELGVPLFDRSQKPIALTPAGELFFPHVQSVLNELNEAALEVTQPSQILTAPGYCGLTPWLGFKLNELLSSDGFLRSQNFLFNIIERSGTEIESRLLDGSLDVGWVISPPKSAPLQFMPIETQEVYCILSADNPLALKDFLSFSDLSGEKFIVSQTEGSSAMLRAVIARCHKAGYSPRLSINSNQDFPNLQLSVQYVQLNYGIAFLPQYIALLQTGTAGIAVRPMDPPMRLRVGLAWNRMKTLSAYEKNFVKCIKDEYLKFIRSQSYKRTE